jgi:chromosome segregation protein
MFRLEKLEISGFKSFADRTSLVFGEGITGVVGPNGCGKSNIAESISWVLGEQSAKNLRGGKMEDVIFSGTRDRKPVGMAEVLLTLVAIEDIAAKDSDDSLSEDEHAYEEAVETAERAAKSARSLVDQLDSLPDERQANNADAPSRVDFPKSETEVEGSAVVPDSPTDASLATDSPPADGAQPLEDAKHIKEFRRRKRKAVAIMAGERVTVGRRLYRTGESDYLMNGRACLLRDIQDLFAGTGLGGAHYAIIEQGRIGQILSSKPLDRRALIEEAAGITKFKSRKRATELKLESARQNLVRLNDIISEIERQVNSLKRQAQKARRYRRLREEMRGVQKLVFTFDYYRLNEANERVNAELQSAQTRQAELDAMLAEREGEHRSSSAQARAAEDNLAGLREQAAATDLEADRVRNRRAFEEQQLTELTARIAELDRDQQAMETRLTLLDEELQRRTGDLKSLEEALAVEQTDLVKRDGEYQSGLARLREAEGALDRLRQRMLVEIGATERLRNLGVNLEDALGRLELKQTNLHEERHHASTRLEEASLEHERVKGETEDGLTRLAQLTGALSERAQTLATVRAQTATLRSELDSIHTRRAAAEHRLASLEDLDAHHAYYSDAVQHVMSPEQAARINALGTLADFVEVEPQYERLVESLFGRELQCVLVPTIDDALAGVDCLKAEGLGRGAFLVVGLHGGEGDPQDYRIEASASDFEPSEPSGARVSDAAGDYISVSRQLPAGEESTAESQAEEDLAIDAELAASEVFDLLAQQRFDEQATAEASRFQLDVLRAIELLGLRPEIRTVVHRAFPDKCDAPVVPDIEAALQLSIENSSQVYVTHDGEQVVNGRLIVSGAQAGLQGTSLLALKREIKELRTHAEDARSEEGGLEAGLFQVQTQLEEIEGEVSTLDSQLRQKEKAIAALDSQLQGLGRELERATQHVRVVDSELEQVSGERSNLESRIAELEVELQAAEASRSTVEASVAEAQTALAAMRQSVEQLAELLSAVRASVAVRSERLNAAKSELRRVENEAEELQVRINRNKFEMYESHSRVEQLTASRAEAEELLSRFDSERASLSAEIEGFARGLAGARALTDELEVALSELRQIASKAHDRRGQIEVERARIQSDAEHLTRTCFTELAMTLEEVVTSVELMRAAEQEPSPVIESDESSAEDFDRGMEGNESEAASDIDAARARMDELRIKLDDMGPVNMMAVEELEEADERFRFLDEQRSDILDSIRMTEDALTEIKRRSRERFRHAFTHINRNFQEMFVELFGGGRGEMILIDEDDPLESGIDLIVQPPGKRLQNVLLLSGGEKAMAAIALVLSIFQYRPSPFCILDEVDAPLDETNVGRFSNKVLQMSRDTQFLVITHNKQTMEAARALYGVTMEELGVSKLVSVKFD